MVPPAGRGQGPPDLEGPWGPGSRDESGTHRYREAPSGTGRWRCCAALRCPERPRGPGRDGTNRDGVNWDGMNWLGWDEREHGAIGNS